MIVVAAAAAVCAALMLYLGKKPPISLTGKDWRWYVAAVLAINIWCVAMLRDNAAAEACTRVFLANILLGMSATDLKEKMVYDIHFYLVLLAGVAAAFASGTAFIGRILLFLILMGVLFLASRKKEALSMGDSRMIASLALYFSLSRWMEVMLLALGTAAIYGIFGMLRKKKTMATELPFMPFLLLGVLAEYMM